MHNVWCYEQHLGLRTLGLFEKLNYGLKTQWRVYLLNASITQNACVNNPNLRIKLHGDNSIGRAKFVLFQKSVPIENL